MTYAGLKVEQVQAAEFLARGIDEDQVATTIGVTAKMLQRWNKQKNFQTAVDLFRHGAIEIAAEQRNAATILSEAAPGAADTLVGLMEYSEKDEVKKQAADSILDRGGFGKQVDIKHTVVHLDAEYLKNLQKTQAMEEIPVTPTEEVVDE